MNRRLLNTIITVVLAYLLSLVFPWWSVMLAAFIASVLIPLKKSSVFFSPFLAIFLLWVILSYSMGKSNDFVLAQRISDLLSLGGNAYVLLLVTGLIGGLAAGVAAVFGKQIRNVFSSEN